MKNSWTMIGLCLFILSCGPNEKALKSYLSYQSHANRTQEDLGASDVSILVPLQNSIFNDPKDSVFGKKGTGMCNAPKLDLGGADPILSESLWQNWAKDSLMSVLPMPANAAAWTAEAVNAGLGELQSQLKTDMAAIPDVASVSDDLCPEPIGGKELRTDDVEILRNEGTNVAVTQTLPAGACHYKNWRVVAARFEPCSYRTTVLAQNGDGLNPATHPQFPAEACGGAELRLVFQPFIANADGGYSALDLAMHAFYKLDNLADFIADLRTMQAITKGVLAASPESDQTSVWYAGQKEMLLPHPGLREEMDCPLGDNAPAAVGIEWRRILAKYARESKLFKLTWMTSDNSGGNWSFGLRLVQPVAGRSGARYLTRLEPFKVETFTLSQVSRGFPYTPFDLSLKSLDYFYRAGHSDTLLTSDAGRASLKELLEIADPDQTSLNLGGKKGASCTSCHTRDMTEKAVRQRSGKTHGELAALAGVSMPTFAIWEPLRKNIEKRNENNLRNFGYGPAMTLGVSLRALNETHAVQLLVNRYFTAAKGEGGGNGESKAAITTAAAGIQAPFTFDSDIRPVLEARCGYCHSSKRSPALLKERTAEIYRAAIVRNICSHPLSFQHMPPGKMLPEGERAMIRQWANALYAGTEPLDCADPEVGSGRTELTHGL